MVKWGMGAFSAAEPVMTLVSLQVLDNAGYDMVLRQVLGDAAC